MLFATETNAAHVQLSALVNAFVTLPELEPLELLWWAGGRRECADLLLKPS